MEAERLIEIKPVAFADPDAQRLMRAALADLSARYGDGGDATPVDPAQFEPPAGCFVVAYLDGMAVGCGGWRSHDGAGGAAAEVKRMYTDPVARGRGVARAVLAALEDSARDRGKRRMILETGQRQPEAIALYHRSGYQRIDDFGFYRDEPEVVSFGRDL